MHPPDACNQPTPGAQRRMERGQSRTHDIGRDEDQRKPDQLKGPGFLDVRHTLTPHSHVIDEPESVIVRSARRSARSRTSMPTTCTDGSARRVRTQARQRPFLRRAPVRPAVRDVRQPSELAGEGRREKRPAAADARPWATSVSSSASTRTRPRSLCRCGLLVPSHSRSTRRMRRRAAHAIPPDRDEYEMPVRTSRREPLSTRTRSTDASRSSFDRITHATTASTRDPRAIH